MKRRVIVRFRPYGPAMWIISAAFVAASYAACYGLCALLAAL